MSIKVKINNDWVDTNIQAVRGVNHVNSEDVYTKTESDALFSGKISKTDIIQSTGTSTTSVMSQKAISDALSKKADLTNNQQTIRAGVTWTNDIYLGDKEYKISFNNNGDLTYNGDKVMIGSTVSNEVSLVQNTGQSTTSVMSQKTVSDAIAAEETRAKEAEKNLDNKVTDLEAMMIYDVSANNNGAVFESLQALLSSSNLSTLIPPSVRHGGMSIRFIQGSVPNSDNKYIQYRYIGTATTGTPNPFLDTDNWTSGDGEFLTGEKVSEVGIDDKPTLRSKNLVTSGGVAEKTDGIDSLKHEEEVKVGGTKDYNVTQYWSSDNNLFLIAPVADYFTITKIKIHVVKHADAQYKFKLITVTPTGTMPITSISDEIILSAPEGDSDDQIVTLQTPFVVPAGQGFGIITSDGYWTRSQASTNTDNLIGIIRISNISYSNAVIGSNTLPYSISFTNHFNFPFTFYNERMVFNDFVLQSEYNAKINEIEGNIEDLTDKTNTVSIIGDSISTFNGYQREGYAYYYPIGDVTNVEQTYWYKFVKHFGFDFDNLSISGSCVTKRTDDASRKSLYERVLVTKESKLFVIALGCNDYFRNVTIGDSYDYDTDISQLSDTVFISAYIKAIKQLYVQYPRARIILLTLSMGDNYANAVKNIAEHYGLPYYDLRSVYTWSQSQPHPDALGMANIANELIKRYGIEDAKAYIDEQDTQLETRVNRNIGNLENNINETFGSLIEEEQSIVDGFSDFTPASSSHTNGNVVLFQQVFTIDRTINQIKARIRKTSDATYRIKLCSFIENDPKGFRITAISDSIQFETPTEDYETQTVDVNFTVAAGARLGILIDTPYAFMVVYSGNACTVRQETTPYDNATVGTVYWSGYAPGSISFPVNMQITPYYQKRYVPEFTKQSESAVLDTRLDVMQTEIDVANNEELVWHKGNWYHGSFIESNNNYVSIKKALYCTKGTVISSSFQFNIIEVIDNVVSSSNLVGNVTGYRFTEDKYVVLSVDLGSVNAITQGQEAAYAHSDFIIIGKDDRNELTNFGNKGNELINNMEIRRVPMITKNEQWMTHVGSMMFDDADNKILWVSYYAKNYNVPNPTKEDASDANTYCCLAKIHLYDSSKPIEYCEILKANTTIAGFENGALPPYDPSIAHIEGDIITVLFECYEGDASTGQRGFATAIISKTAFETAISSGETSTLSGLKICNPTSISKHILTYNGVQYNLDCAGVKSFYDTFSGGSITLPSNLCIATHPVLYNGYYYVTFQDIFDNTGLKPILMKTQDFVNWDFVKAFTEIVDRGGTVESSIVIKNDILYFSSRQTGSASIYLLYDMVNDVLLFPPRSIPMGISIKTTNVLYNDRVLCISNMGCVYKNGVDGNRKNMGIYEIFEDGNIKLVSTLKNDAGMHYPDFAQNNRQLYLLFSEDRRYLDRETQRTNLTVARMLV